MHVASIVLAFSLATYDPLAGDLARFPPPEVVSANWEFNRAHGVWLEERFSQPYYLNWWQENFNLGRTWELLVVAQAKNLGVEKREDALMELLGTTNFYLARMPPPSPIWRFFDYPPPELP